ncbi:MAG: DNA-directed RNA polymerase subunit alpha [Deltaproteobacteria bacterium]|nr:DNA-directed RNA polymerase subunit alpha [Deltaproteobacteria bacterium]MBW1845686.1 DNA-directed RNA polymerase subunit alpha [Deltaproteobacteria bacterium]MBW2179039.1 DNA-directed RNA polymerase subunit alpha [Deltaproteobacteria bacterium]MBW2363608.1 DNA-directed RNA polymerase subunit alpha [Deltaproteobacteria bacterium]
MYMNWREMIKPEKVQVTSQAGYGKFVCEPLERGFGITMGNSLRRIILSSLYGAAIVSVKFDSVMHEFSVIKGVYEDVSEIILNLKEVRLRLADTEPRTIKIDAKGPGKVTSNDIISGDGKCEILNPDLLIATLSEKTELKMTMNVQVGKGYSLAEENKEEDAPIGTIPIDSVFSPIRRVNYVVGNARVGQRTDYDKLTLEVWTDNSVLPEDAVAYAAKILKEQMNPFINFDEELEPEPIKMTDETEKPQFNDNLNRSVEELELSVRSANCLKNADILKIFQLVSKTEAEMLRTKNFGRKSLNEIKEVLSEMGLSLGMKLDGFTPSEEENVEGE